MRNPVSGDFFSQDAIENASEALVREAVQNSLDAGRSGEEILVRIRVIEGLGRSAQNRIGKLLESLEPHLQSAGNGLIDPPGVYSCERYAVIEDFGTTGLQGDPTDWDPDAGDQNDFFAFFRAEGYSSKEGDDRGRWGVGKTVFPRSSRINTFFGLTRTRSASSAIIMGRCILKMHKVGEASYVPDGYFGIVDEDLVLPSAEPADLSCLEQSFEITPRGPGDAGLSVVVPFLDETITHASLLRAAVRGYFYPILQGVLRIEILANDDCWRLDRHMLKHIASEQRNIVGDDILPIVELASWAIEAKPAPLEIPAPDGNSPQWEDIALSQATIEQGRGILTAQVRQAFRAAITVRPRGAAERPSFLSVYMSSAGDQERRRPVFVRDGIVISNAAGATIRGRHALVCIDDPPLATLLGDAENVAHTEWNKDRSLFSQKYLYAKSYLTFVRKAPAEIVRLLTAGDMERDSDLLQDILSILLPPEDDDSDEEEGGRGRRGRKQTPGPGGAPARPRPFRMHRMDGGFIVSPGDPGAPSVKGIRIRMAYDTSRGSPLKSWDQADFKLEDGVVSVRPEGECVILSCAGNELTADVTGSDFRITVAGFDVNRDLYVRAEPLSIGNEQ
jgi:hypothetical protein